MFQNEAEIFWNKTCTGIEQNNITSYGLIVNVERVKHTYILYNPQVLLVIAQPLKAGASD